MWLKNIVILLLSLFEFDNISFKPQTVPSEEPEQIHLSIAGKWKKNSFQKQIPDYVVQTASHPQLAVTWTTYVKVESIVQFGKNKQLQLESMAVGNVTEFVDNGNRTHFIHRVILTDLEPLTRYCMCRKTDSKKQFDKSSISDYRCGSNGKWSDLYSFKTLTDETDWSPKMIVIGDMGVANAVSFEAIQSEVATGEVDVLMHNGDLAYNLASVSATSWQTKSRGVNYHFPTQHRTTRQWATHSCEWCSPLWGTFPTKLAAAITNGWTRCSSLTGW